MAQLRTATAGNMGAWSKDELRAGFNHFKELHGRYPTAHEIDAFPYLPSARSMQRTFGGLVNVRKELFPEEIANYTLGAHRSDVAKITYANGKALEKQFFDYLTSCFSEIAVHEQKVIRPGNVSSDFFIYLTPSTGIVIDIFYAKSIINLVNVVNIKLKRYALIEPETYLVVAGNDTLSQGEIDTKVRNRRIALPAHISVASESHFNEVIIPKLQKRSDYSALSASA